MRYPAVLTLLISFLLTGCVGTVQDTKQSFTKVNDAPKSSLNFSGLASATAISDSRIEVFFYPASGGSGRYTYDIIVGNAPFPVSTPSDVLKPDFRGLLKVTLTGLTRLTSYQIRVEVRESDSSIQSNSGVNASVITFDHFVSDFNGISSAYNTPGQDGKDSVKIRWTPARISGSLTKQPWDPKSYEIVLVDAEKLTPLDMDYPYTPAEGRWVYGINHDDTINEYIVRGLPSKTRFYVRMRAIHDKSIEDVYDPKKRSELNTNYVIISTLSDDLADIDFNGSSFAVVLAPGEQGLNAIYGSWDKATGVFDHFRLYYSEAGGGVAMGSLPDLCLSPLLAPVAETVFCKRATFDADNAPITGLTPYTDYEVVLVLCATTACLSHERIISPVRTITTDPSFPSFNGIKEIMMAQDLSQIGKLYLKFDPPNFLSGYFDGLILKMRRTVDGSDPEVEVTEITDPVYHANFNFLLQSEVEVAGVNYLSEQPYCFTLYPFKWDNDGITKRESPNDIWRCVQPQPEAPTALQFSGLNVVSTEGQYVLLAWNAPSGGIFSHFELFWSRPGVNFNWGDAISQAGNNFNFANYGLRVIPYDTNQIVLDGFADGEYSFGIITYYTYVTDSDVVILRSETNDEIRTCIVNNSVLIPSTCI
jgi:hypothetical protein